MFGIDDLAIAGLIASLAGTAISYNSQQQAAKRANQASLDAMRRQQEYQRQAEQTALERANDYKTENRQEKQEAIRQELEQEHSAPALCGTGNERQYGYNAGRRFGRLPGGQGEIRRRNRGKSREDFCESDGPHECRETIASE